jgi:hypothetical protein
MSGLSKSLELLDRHSRLAAHEAEMIARARDALARSEALLQESPPSTFLGKPQTLAPKE